MIPTYCNQVKTYNGTLNISIVVNRGGGKGNRYGRGIAKKIAGFALQVAILRVLPVIIEEVSNTLGGQ